MIAQRGKAREKAALPSRATIPPDVGPATTISTSGGGPQGAGLAQGDKFFLQLADQKDVGRISGEVIAERSVPLGERRYSLTEPRAWFFLEDGQSVYVESRSGTFTAGQRATGGTGGGIEQGTLVGDVVLRLYAMRSDGARPDPQQDQATGILRTSRMSIDWTLGQFDVPDDFNLTWDTIANQMAYQGKGIIAQFDPQTQVLDSLAIASTREIVIAPAGRKSVPTQRDADSPTAANIASGTFASAGVNVGANAGANIGTGPDTQPSAAEAGTTSSTGDTPALQAESLYSVMTDGAVRITRGLATVEAASLRGGARLIDGTLPQRHTSATSQETQASAGNNNTQHAPAATSAEQVDIATSPPPTPETIAAASITRIKLAGPLEVRRLIDGTAPAELLRDDWWAALGSSPERDVEARDQERGLSVRANSMVAMGTRGLITLESTNAGGVQVISKDSGTLEAQRLEVDRGGSVARVVGAGRLTATEAGGEDESDTADGQIAKAISSDEQQSAPATIRWSEKADFVFAPGNTAGAGAGAEATGGEFERLERAHFLGRVESVAQGSTISGNEMMVAFAALPNPEANANPESKSKKMPATDAIIAERAQVLGRARVRDAKENLIEGDLLTVDFVRGVTGQATPTTFDVQGQARAVFGEQTLDARSIRGSLREVVAKAETITQPTIQPSIQTKTQANPTSSVEVASLVASGSASTPVRFVGKDGLLARARTIEADPSLQRATLLGIDGELAVVARDELDQTQQQPDAGASKPASNLASGSASGTRIDLDGLARTARLPNGGTLAFRETDATGLVRTIDATSTGLIALDESAGLATMERSVVASLKDAISTATLEAERLQVRFEQREKVAESKPATTQGTPDPSATARDAQGIDAPTNQPAMTVRVTMIEAQSPDSLVQATIRSLDDDAPTMYYVEAPELHALPLEQSLEARGAGRLLATRAASSERTPGSKQSPATNPRPQQPGLLGASASSDTGSAGDTLVSWKDRMTYSQTTNQAQVVGGVRLIHRGVAGTGTELDRNAQANTPTTPVTPSLLECETLTLELMSREQGDASQPSQPPPSTSTLRSAIAVGGVWGSMQGQEFTSARATFDAIAGMLLAFGDASTTVTVAATKDQPPLDASQIRINTRTGRVEVVDPGTIQTGPSTSSNPRPVSLPPAGPATSPPGPR